MLLLIGPARDRRYNTYICRGSDRQIEPLGPDVIDVVSDVLEIVRDIITVNGTPRRHLGVSLAREGEFRNPWNPPLATPLYHGYGKPLAIRILDRDPTGFKALVSCKSQMVSLANVWVNLIKQRLRLFFGNLSSR